MLLENIIKNILSKNPKLLYKIKVQLYMIFLLWLNCIKFPANILVVISACDDDTGDGKNSLPITLEMWKWKSLQSCWMKELDFLVLIFSG